MPRVSRIPVKDTVTEELDDQFSYLISFLSTSKDIQYFFEEFLTKEEKLMLTKRLMLYLLLEKGYHTVDICLILGITRETVRVHSKLWEKVGVEYRQIITRLANRRSTKQFWQNVEKVLQPIDLFLRSKSNMKARKKFASAEYD